MVLEVILRGPARYFVDSRLVAEVEGWGWTVSC